MEKKTTLVESFDAALRGLFYCLRKERNFRFHFFFGIFVLIFFLFLNLSLVEFFILLLIITLVLTTEMVNTSIEETLNVVSPELHPLAKTAKNIAAGSVLVTSASSVIIGYLLLSKHFPIQFVAGIETIRCSSWYITFIALILTIAVVFLSKIRLHAHSLFQGGMPSGHSALSFSLWAAISFLTIEKNPLVMLLCLPLAILVAQSRVAKHLHRLSEVVIGSLLGILITTLIFQIFRF